MVELTAFASGLCSARTYAGRHTDEGIPRLTITESVQLAGARRSCEIHREMPS